MPSGLEVSHSGLALEAGRLGDQRRDLGDRDVLAGADVDLLWPVVVLHQVQAGVGHVVDVEELAARLPVPQLVTWSRPSRRASS